MNAKQALRFARKNIEELEDYKARATRDITAYNLAILSHIEGRSLCDWCNDARECEKAEKTAGKACGDWLLTYDVEILEEDEEDADESAGVFQAGSEG